MKISKFISGPMQISEALLVVYLIGKNDKTYKNWERSKRFNSIEGDAENISDWLAKGMMGMNMLIPHEEMKRKLELSPHGIKIYEQIITSDELVAYLEELETSLKANPSESLRWPDEKFFTLLEDTGVLDVMLEAVQESIVQKVVVDFFAAEQKVKKAEFKAKIWDFANDEEVITKSKTANASDNRAGSIEKIFTELGIIGEYNGEYILLDQNNVLEIDVIIPEVKEPEFEDKKVNREVKVRTGQAYFRKKLIKRDKKCVICSIDHPDLLAAGHIKKHSGSDKNEKYDIDNGILLCKLHDKLFEECMIAFLEDGTLIFGKYVEENQETLLLDKYKISNEIDYKNKYFDIHRKNFYNKNS